MRTKGYTSMKISRGTLAILNQMRAEEAGRLGSFVTQEDFLKFLLNLYQAVKGDTPVLTSVWKKIRKL